MNSNIRERIKKLLALGTSPNQHEANSAILKAKQLMAEHKLSDSDFLKSDEVPIEIDTGLYYTTRKNGWITAIAGVIAENNCCVKYVRTTSHSQTHRIIIYGFKEDAIICKNTILYAMDCVNSLLKPIIAKMKKDPYEDAKTIEHACASFGLGFSAGLADAYEDQIEENQEWGLVMVIPPEVSKKIEELKIQKWKQAEYNENRLLYNNGYQEGLRFTAKDKLEVSVC